LPERLYRSSPLTLFVFVRSSCAACQSAKPIFASIAPRLRQASADVVIVTSGAHADDEGTYARDVGVDAAHLVRLDITTLKVKLVPTAVLVDRSGRVLFTVEGVPSASDQQQLLRAAAVQRPAAQP